jgi:hypothetical protein
MTRAPGPSDTCHRVSPETEGSCSASRRRSCLSMSRHLMPTAGEVPHVNPPIRLKSASSSCSRAVAKCRAPRQQSDGIRFTAQPLEHREVSKAVDVADGSPEALADAGQSLKPSTPSTARICETESPSKRSVSAAVRAHAERIRALLAQ